jgi:hypothetical protein
MRELVKIKDTDDFMKDPKSGALINTNNTALQNYKNQKRQASRIDIVEEKINSLSDDVQQIKQMLMDLTRNG